MFTTYILELDFLDTIGTYRCQKGLLLSHFLLSNVIGHHFFIPSSFSQC